MSSGEIANRRTAVILAGGGSTRMQGGDKAEIDLAGVRLIDRVAAILSGQVQQILISGPGNYDTPYTAIPDRTDGPNGPAAGVWSIAKWMNTNCPDLPGFLAAPVDGPFLPNDLFDKLYRENGCAYACDETGTHPTFSYWTVHVVLSVGDRIPAGHGVSLHAMAEMCQASQVAFSDNGNFSNINTRTDLSKAERRLSGAG